MQILVIDDHEMLCVALAERLQREASQILSREITVRTAFRLADGVRDLSKSPSPDIVFLDLNLDGDNRGVTTFHKFQDANKEKVPVVLHTALDTHDAGNVEAFRECVCLATAPARGVVRKAASVETSLIGLRRLLIGERWIDSEVMDALMMPRQPPPGLEKNKDIPLTPRQMEVARCLARGLQDCEIARELKLSDLFVRQVVHQIIRKLGKRNRYGVVGELYARKILTA